MHTIIIICVLFLISCTHGNDGESLESRALGRINELIEDEINLLEKINQAIHFYAKGKKSFRSKPDVCKYWTLLNRLEFQRLEKKIQQIKSLKRRLIHSVLNAFPHNKRELEGLEDMSIRDYVHGNPGLSAAYSDLAVSDSLTNFDTISDRAISGLKLGGFFKDVAKVAGGVLSNSDGVLGAAGRVLQKVGNGEKVDIVRTAADVAGGVVKGDVGRGLRQIGQGSGKLSLREVAGAAGTALSNSKGLGGDISRGLQHIGQGQGRIGLRDIAGAAGAGLSNAKGLGGVASQVLQQVGQGTGKLNGRELVRIGGNVLSNQQNPVLQGAGQGLQVIGNVAPGQGIDGATILRAGAQTVSTIAENDGKQNGLDTVAAVVSTISQTIDNARPGAPLHEVLLGVVKGLQDKGLFKGRAAQIVGFAMNALPLLSQLGKNNNPQNRTQARWNLIRLGVSFLADNTRGRVSEVARMIGKFLDESSTSIAAGDRQAVFKGLLTNFATYLSRSSNRFLQFFGNAAQQYLQRLQTDPKLTPRGALLYLLQTMGLQFLKQSNNQNLNAAGSVLEMLIRGVAPSPDQPLPQFDQNAGTGADPNAAGGDPNAAGGADPNAGADANASNAYAAEATDFLRGFSSD